MELSDLDRFRSFELSDADDGLFVSAFDNESRSLVMLSADSSSSKLVVNPLKRVRPRSTCSITASKALEILSNEKLLSE